MDTKKIIYFVQVDIMRKLIPGYSAYLPYAAGALWAYAKQASIVAENYALREIFFLRDPVDAIASRMEEPFLVGFSCYCWSEEYNKALAQAVKRLFPGCYILFGGHNVPPGGTMLEELTYVDFLIHGEGEIPLQALLLELCKETPDFARVPGLSYRFDGKTKTNTEAYAQSVEDFPSPYLEGILDSIIETYPEILWNTVWETNRGCPHHCYYCDWGQHKARVRRFPMKRLMAEIEWMSANKVGYIFCADANFGILERDEEIVDALVAANKQTGNPRLLNYNTTKILDDRLFRIIEKLSLSGLDKSGPNFAVQSLSPVVLRNIGRQNIDDETLSKWIRRCHRAGYMAHTDLILGLPGETLQSFCAGVEKLLSLGQHEGIQYFPCYLLPNALLATPANREKYMLRTTRRIYKQSSEAVPETEQIHEFLDTVIETSAMPYTDWLTANHFRFLVQATHGFGALRLVAMHLHTEKIVSYADFYLRLLSFCDGHPETLVGEAMARIEKNFADGLHGEELEPLQIPGFSFGRTLEDQYFFGHAVLEPNRFYAEVMVFLERFGLEPGLLAQLLRYQRESILMPYPAEKELIFDYDFPAYFKAIYDGDVAALQKRTVLLRFSFDRDLSTIEVYYDLILQHGRHTSNAFYRIEEIDAI